MPEWSRVVCESAEGWVEWAEVRLCEEKWLVELFAPATERIIAGGRWNHFDQLDEFGREFINRYDYSSPI